MLPSVGQGNVMGPPLWIPAFGLVWGDVIFMPLLTKHSGTSIHAEYCSVSVCTADVSSFKPHGRSLKWGLESTAFYRCINRDKHK